MDNRAQPQPRQNAESATVPGVLIDAAATGTSTVWSVGYRYEPNLARLRTLSMRTTNG